MRPIREPSGSVAATCLLLSIVSGASIGLNTDFHAPPRFDGAGYAVLGEALATGRGYREISEPASPRHAHFPPGYPATLALLWSITGRSVEAAHAFSACCTVAAVLLAWRWLGTMYRPRPALMLGLALALNWTWGRVGGSIQSEPLYLLVELLAVLAAIQARRRGSALAGMWIGLALAGCVLVRQVGVCLVAAAMIDLGLRGRWKSLRLMVLVVLTLITPWIYWLLAVRENTQVELLAQENLAARVAGQTVFYVQRLPDQITGPIVEVGTVFQRSAAVGAVVNVWAIVMSGVIIWGWIMSLQTVRRRLAGLAAFMTLAMLLVWPFTEAGRFLIPLVPMLLVGATEGLARVLDLAGVRRPRDWAVAIVLGMSVPYPAYAFAAGRASAQRRTHAEFDAACQWISQQSDRPGLVMTLRPGEVFWQTRRHAVAPGALEPEAIDQRINQLGVVYLLIEEERFANAPANPLVQYVERHADRVRLVWSRRQGAASIQVWEILRGDDSRVSRPLGDRHQDIRLLAAELRARPNDVGIEERRGEPVAGQDGEIRVRPDLRVQVGSDCRTDPRGQPPEALDAQPWRLLGRQRPVTPPGSGAGKLGIQPYGFELAAKQLDELALVKFVAVKRILVLIARVHGPIRTGGDEHSLGHEDAGAFADEGGRVVDVLDRLERHDAIDRAICERDCLSITGTGIEAVLLACVRADVGGNVDADHRLCPRPGESSRAVALAASNVEYSLAADEFLGEAITRDVFPENPGVGLGGHHSLCVVDGTLRVTHSNWSRTIGGCGIQKKPSGKENDAIRASRDRPQSIRRGPARVYPRTGRKRATPLPLGEFVAYPVRESQRVCHL
jgi:hypothetical protein